MIKKSIKSRRTYLIELDNGQMWEAWRDNVELAHGGNPTEEELQPALTFAQLEDRRRADLAAPHFTLSAQSQPKPAGVQGDMFGGRGLDTSRGE